MKAVKSLPQQHYCKPIQFHIYFQLEIDKNDRGRNI